MFHRLMKSKKGFTLMEILVAVVVIGILAGVAASAVPGMIGRAHERALANQLATVQQAVDRFIAEEGVYPVNPGDPDKPNMAGMNQNPAALDVAPLDHEILIEKGYLLNFNTKGGNFGFANPDALFGVTEGGLVFAVDEASWPTTWDNTQNVYTAFDTSGTLTADELN